MSIEDYWFAPLGRERGGLLDLLGLPPDASELQVGNQKAEYQREINNGWKKKAREEKKKLDAGELSKEVFESRKAEFKAEADELLMKLNALNAKYDAKQAALRRQKKEGIEAADSDPWRDSWKAARVEVRELVQWPRAVPRLGDVELDYVAGACEPRGYLERLKRDDALLDESTQYVIVDGELVEDQSLEEEVVDFLDALDLPPWADEQMVSSAVELYQKVEREERAIAVRGLEKKREERAISKREYAARKRELELESAQLWDDMADHLASYRVWRERRCREREGAVRFARRFLGATEGGSGESLEDAAKEFSIWLGLQPWTDELSVALAKQARCRAINCNWKDKAESLERQRARHRISARDLERRRAKIAEETNHLLLDLDDLDRGYKLWRARGSREAATRARFRRLRDENSTITDVAGILAGLLIERDVQLYGTADRLWSKVGSTNRRCWRERIERWIAERSTQPVWFVTRAVDARRDPLLPLVSRPSVLEAGRMYSKEEEDLRRGPVRRVEEPMAAILADLLGTMGKGGGPHAGRSVDRPGVEASQAESDFDAAMRSFAALKALLEEAEAARGRRPDLGRAQRS